MHILSSITKLITFYTLITSQSVVEHKNWNCITKEEFFLQKGLGQNNKYDKLSDLIIKRKISLTPHGWMIVLYSYLILWE